MGYSIITSSRTPSPPFPSSAVPAICSESVSPGWLLTRSLPGVVLASISKAPSGRTVALVAPLLSGTPPSEFAFAEFRPPSSLLTMLDPWFSNWSRSISATRNWRHPSACETRSGRVLPRLQGRLLHGPLLQQLCGRRLGRRRPTHRARLPSPSRSRPRRRVRAARSRGSHRGSRSQSAGFAALAAHVVQRLHVDLEVGRELGGETGPRSGPRDRRRADFGPICHSESSVRISDVVADQQVVELRGFEPLTFSLRTRRATNCATAPSRPKTRAKR